MLDNKLEPYFPTEFRWLGYILMACCVFFLAQGHWIWPPLGLALGIFLAWAYRGTRLDFNKNKLQEYLGVWGIKWGSWKEIPTLEKITITKTKYSQVLGSKGSTSEFKSTIYRAILRGPRDFGVPFISNKESGNVLESARLVAKKLNLPILDCTIKTPVWIT